MANFYDDKSVCIIEDNEIIRKLFVLLLHDKGARIHDFDTGESALEYLADNSADIVLCDIMLPDINGVDVLEAIRRFPGGDETIVVALTAVARQGDRERFLEQGFNGYIPKPINPTSFAEEVMHIAQDA